MPGSTIPEPSGDLIKIARSGLEIQAERFGLDLKDPQIAAFIDHEVKVQAQQLAHINWLENILHRPLKGA